MKPVQQTVGPSTRCPFGRDRAKGVRSRRSSALLLVLGMIVLLSALVLAFLASVSTELTTSQDYANGATVKQLADSATQLVISQIVSGTGNTNSTLAWASQPGMIRTYDVNGKPALFYKLYSSSTMITNAAAATFVPANEAPPANWDTGANVGLYTDLNSPVSSGGTNYFPIIDPRALATTTAASVEGFTYTNVVTENSSTATMDQVALPSAGTANQRLPMPVLWLYVLQNGALITPVSGNAGTVSFDAADTALMQNGTNPIVGRVAFWTDDETCKININTASEGTPWDRPWAHTATEEKNSTAIPGQNEFQRYPGHPAKTCLSPVLDPILPAPVPAWCYGISSSTQAANTNELTAYYSLAPRTSLGGTMGGNFDDTNAVFTAISAKGDRLYASPDELLYSTNLSSNVRQPNSTLVQANSGLAVALNNGYLEKAKFFLTAHSRAPEVNLFGKPRMTLWPLQMSTALRNAKDTLIAFCSTINGKAYYFQRQNAYTAFGTPCSSQDPAADWTATDSTGATRNQTLYSYISNLAQQNIPGFGGNFAAKYPNTYNQIITEMFDTIRSGVNSYSTALTPTYTYTPQLGDSGEGQVVPLAPPSGTPGAGTRGFGRFATITDAALIFYRCNACSYLTNATGAITVPHQLNPATAAPQIASVLVLQPFTPSPGLPAWSPNVHYVIVPQTSGGPGLQGFSISSPSTPAAKLGFPASPIDDWANGRMCYSGSENNTAGNTTAFLSFKDFFRCPVAQGTGFNGDDYTKVLGLQSSNYQYPFFSNTGGSTYPITGVQIQSANDTTFNFLGGSFAIQIWSDSNGKDGTLLQTINMTFPAVNNLPMPTTAAQNTDYDYSNRFMGRANTVPTGGDQQYTRDLRTLMIECEDRYAGTDTSGVVVVSRTMDVARGLQPDPINSPAKGDLRVYAALTTVPSTYFTTSTNYDSGTNPQTYAITHSLRDGAYAGVYGNGDEQFGWDMNTPNPTEVSPTTSSTIGYPYMEMHTWQLAGNLVPKANLASGTSSGTGNNAGPSQPEYYDGFNPAVPPGLTGAFQNGGALGDWDNMTGSIEDGPYINKPDEGDSDTASNLANTAGDFRGAAGAYSGGTYGNSWVFTITGGYFSRGLDRFGTGVSGGGGDYRTTTGATFSPNRQVSSAVMFGSLPTGIDPTGANAPRPWQTLLFCPNPPAGSSHPGLGVPATGPPYTTPPDHLFLDLFTMPIVEPYAISEPLSTAGKVNMNYQILPFTYITRDTAVRAVLKSTRLMAIPSNASTENTLAPRAYKEGFPYPYECRYNINPGTETANPPVSDGTLAGFQARFNNGDIFRCASEICDIYLVPMMIPGASSSTFLYPSGMSVPATYSATAAWWNNFLLTGDNTREAPYGDIYPRLTTKSNTYTVHVRVQTLKKVLGTSATQWVEGTDLVTGEYRGSSLIERYIDTSDPNLPPDFAATGSPSVEGFYKIRIVSSKKFAP